MEIRTDKEKIAELRKRVDRLAGDATQNSLRLKLQIAHLREDNRALKRLLKEHGIEFKSTFNDKPWVESPFSMMARNKKS